MIPKFPYEIISLIASHLESYDQSTCALVCKQLTEPFQNAHWYRLDMNNYIIKGFFNKSQNNTYLTNAHRVVELTIDGLNEHCEKYYLKMQQLYPDIKRLEYYESSQTNQILKMINWNSWKTLSHLKISFHFKIIIVPRTLFTKLSVLSCLTHLTLHSILSVWAVYKNQAPFSWLDIELLHTFLPQLEDLDVKFMLTPIPKQDINIIRRITPAYTIKKFCCSNHYINAYWMFYFALKYPNLLEIELEIDGLGISERPITQKEDYQNEIQLLSTLDRFFPCLKKTRVRAESFNEWRFSMFFDTLLYFNVNIETAKLSYYEKCTIEPNKPKSLLSVTPESLRVLWIELLYFSDEEPITKRFVLYLGLVELHFEVYVQIEIDVILDKCPLLRLLYIKSGKVYLSEQSNNITGPHPLRRLNLQGIISNTQVFEYISFRCKKLSFLKLNSVDFKEFALTETRRLLFDMSFSQLDTLIICNIRLKYDKVKHFIIEQVSNVDDGSLDLDYLEGPAQSSWYYIHLDPARAEKVPCTWKLDESDIKYAQEYCKNIKKGSFSGISIGSMGEAYGGYESKDFWKKDLQNGIFVVRVQSVKDYYLDTEKIESMICML
ncbi:hypothetical protein J3Q64DRAFT_1876985 [Phycomyces blakesleeanus]|uniref:F-box domain-containing protein n=2 Tax=Phycomyces blakesleeanus TaxID=4837 RepID=A0A163A842_PHYB8|nr:hypothetical protein PHYBLDRAFT_73936 [Phycomyces blakesleeanus NRRL 1555(-)]OAD71701.1 hypothetical protein PHYBLDRAFT_73936 [Phycomyces blakesleeanus NRRL 1555(-)]|eukprot:XP_018289741.1 hypothetical protein PHYBLDRAFT_73936 [Phycomyces blakesleeanus NRRL 1555(-)]